MCRLLRGQGRVEKSEPSGNIVRKCHRHDRGPAFFDEGGMLCLLRFRLFGELSDDQVPPLRKSVVLVELTRRGRSRQFEYRSPALGLDLDGPELLQERHCPRGAIAESRAERGERLGGHGFLPNRPSKRRLRCCPWEQERRSVRRFAAGAALDPAVLWR